MIELIEYPSLYNNENSSKVKHDSYGRIVLNGIYGLDEHLLFAKWKQNIFAFAGVNSEIGII